MREQHDHEDDDSPVGAAAKPHDPRLDSSGEEHPAVQPLPFDLIALENTRTGLRILGLGLGLVAFAVPMVVGAFARQDLWVSLSGWMLTALGFLGVILGVAIAAPTPHGPLPRFARGAAVLLGIVALISATVQGFTDSPLIFPYFNAATDGMVPFINEAARVALLALPWILWRFCQQRGLTGRAIVWLWIAMAGSALALAARFTETTSALLFGFPLLGVIVLFAARQTSRDVWLDALYRNTKFHALSKPNASVEPLRPAGDR